MVLVPPCLSNGFQDMIIFILVGDGSLDPSVVSIVRARVIVGCLENLVGYKIVGCHGGFEGVHECAAPADGVTEILLQHDVSAVDTHRSLGHGGPIMDPPAV